jgi:hypothetical protein
VCVYVCVGVGVHVSIYAYCHMGELYLCALSNWRFQVLQRNFGQPEATYSFLYAVDHY